MDAAGPWTCAACGAGNAAYRRRCLECGERRPIVDDGQEEDESAVVDAAPRRKVDPTDVPLPMLARRRARSDRSWATAILVLAVLGLAVYGVVSYVGSDRPTAADDAAALRSAGADFLAGAVVVSEGGISPDLLDPTDRSCLGLLTEILGILDRHATAALDARAGPGEFVSMQAFETRSAAVRFDDALSDAARAGCAPPLNGRTWAVLGRVRVEVAPGPGAEVMLGEMLARLEIEG